MAEKYSQEHWERVAEVYEASPASPAVAIAEKFGVARPTARAWILRLRRDGLIRETSHGRTAEQHDRITRIAADLKVERHELAQIILRHIPNGKLYIHERDATPTSAPTDFAATFGSVIRDARKERGWTQADLASSRQRVPRPSGAYPRCLPNRSRNKADSACRGRGLRDGTGLVRR